MTTENYDESVEINHNPNWPYIPDHPYRILIIGGSGSGKNYCVTERNKTLMTRYDKIYSYFKN